MNQHLAIKGAKKTITFHICETQVHKKTVLLQFIFLCFFCAFQFVLFETKTLMLNKKHNLKSGKSKDKKKGIWNRKARQETKRKRKYFRKKRNCNWKCSCCSFHETKAKKKEKWKRDKNKKQKESKEERQEGRKKDKRKRERQRKRNRKRGRPKKVKGERKRNIENKQKKCPFLGGKQVFCLLKKTKKAKQRKKTKTKKNEKKIRRV